ncbi:hypothetical protein PAHAL_8G107200 [Panicum hallii]|uniref:Uncharacterized protein n=1 Tax=Panicum hallii TaxID=206008 RepID=A0A2T8I8F3_9POAL|nr:hypothetical protein PAHAL_8G107200 [Panicum hallii]
MTKSSSSGQKKTGKKPNRRTNQSLDSEQPGAGMDGELMHDDRGMLLMIPPPLPLLPAGRSFDRLTCHLLHLPLSNLPLQPRFCISSFPWPLCHRRHSTLPDPVPWPAADLPFNTNTVQPLSADGFLSCVGAFVAGRRALARSFVQEGRVN